MPEVEAAPPASRGTSSHQSRVTSSRARPPLSLAPVRSAASLLDEVSCCRALGFKTLTPVAFLSKTRDEKLRVLSESKFVVFVAESQKESTLQLHPTFMYEVLRAKAIPVMVSGPYLAAYANKFIEYDRVSLRIGADEAEIATLGQKLKQFDFEEALRHVGNASSLLMWPLDGVPSVQNAAGPLFNMLITRYRVFCPVFRRSYIGRGEFI